MTPPDPEEFAEIRQHVAAYKGDRNCPGYVSRYALLLEAYDRRTRELEEARAKVAHIERLFAEGHDPKACLAGSPAEDCELCGREGIEG